MIGIRLVLMALVVCTGLVIFALQPFMQARDTDSTNPNDRFALQFRTILFDPKQRWALVEGGCAHSYSPRTWMPTHGQVDEFEAKLAPLLTVQLRSHDRLLFHHAKDYYRQYAGLIENEHRLICVFGFHKIALTPRWLQRWRTYAQGASDGGVTYFEAAYDLDTQQIVKFAFHGVA
ncbi:MAG: hypothetical protein ABL973_10595 [Micropepsaceae bacterium]